MCDSKVVLCSLVGARVPKGSLGDLGRYTATEKSRKA